MNGKLMGYLDSLSYNPGEKIVARVSGHGRATAHLAKLAKVGPFETESRIVAGCPKMEADLAVQPLDAGSGFMFALEKQALPTVFSVETPMQLTLIDENRRVFIELVSDQVSLQLIVSDNGLAIEGNIQLERGGPIKLIANRWVDLSIRIDRATGLLTAIVGNDEIVARFNPSEADERWMISIGRGLRSFGNGCYAKFEGPTVFNDADRTQPVATFDFSSNFASPTLVSNGITGKFLNHPTRRILGQLKPDILNGFQDTDSRYYGAIHVHAFDLTDAQWAQTFEIEIPQNCTSGIYAIDIHTDRNERLRLPLAVRPREKARAKVLFILPTNTYLAYGNERLAFSDRGAAISADTDGIQLNEFDEALGAEPLLGASIYDRHADGSGVHYSSRRRPLLNLSPDYEGWWCTQVPRHFLADLNIPRWLDHIEVPFDVVTDEDVHMMGSELLKSYNVVITGTHPEYPSPENLKAMHEFSAVGNLMYMGGNGFYWVTGHDPSDPGIIEARRGYAGQRNWTSHPLEVRLSTNGQTGGLWRHRGMAPNLLTGMGSVAVGFTRGSGYERTDASYKEEFAHFFEGVGDIIGEEGEILGAAASDELDAGNHELGTPETAVVLARSRHNRTYLPFIEEELEIQHNLGGDHNPTVRSEIIYFERETGGKVFAAGAINFCGALGVNGFDNSAAKLVTNVLGSFLARSCHYR